MVYIAVEGSDGFHVPVGKGHRGSYIRVELTSTVTSKTIDDHGGPNKNKGRTSAAKTSKDNQRANLRRYGKAALECLSIVAGAAFLAGAVALMGPVTALVVPVVAAAVTLLVVVAVVA